MRMSWKSRNICEKGNCYLKKKKSQIKQWLRLIEIIFSDSFPHPDCYSWEISYEYLSGPPEPTEEEIIRLCLCHTIFMNS